VVPPPAARSPQLTAHSCNKKQGEGEEGEEGEEEEVADELRCIHGFHLLVSVHSLMRGGGVTLFVSSVLFVVAFASSALAFAPVRVPLASRPEQVLARSSTSSLESPVEKRMDLRNVIQHQEKESDKIPPPLSEMPPLGYGISRWPRMSQIDVKQVSRDVSEWATMAIAVPAVVILWAGAWMLLDSVVPGGTMWPKELFFALAGGIWMVNSNVMFCSAYMDSLRGRTMWDDRPTGPPRLTLSYAETLGNKVAYYLEVSAPPSSPVYAPVALRYKLFMCLRKLVLSWLP
jgi:hypothetical protein